jgi:hypothetical protein
MGTSCIRCLERLAIYAWLLIATVELAASWHLFPIPARPPTRPPTQLRSSTPPRSSEGSDKSIADYTLGLHGRKYDFSNAGFSQSGQDFAASLYSGGDDEGTQIDYTQEPLPDWAVRLSELTADSVTSSAQTLPVDGKVRVVNDEMTWERFYAFVVPQPTAATVEPWAGLLPRRGETVLQVQRNGSEGPSWLVVGTEEDRWFYTL